MTENQWTKSIQVLIADKLGANFKVRTLVKIPYANEIRSFSDETFQKLGEQEMSFFEVDMFIYEIVDKVFKPRVVVESKLKDITTHDPITYSYKANAHKEVMPFIRYGIMLGDRKHHPLPGRLFRHGINFDFMMSFVGESPTEKELEDFVDVLKSEITYSQQIEEMLYSNRQKSRKHYHILHKKLSLE